MISMRRATPWKPPRARRGEARRRAGTLWLAELAREEGLRPEGLRGAPIPSGDDVLLSPTDGVWLIGDAAGLATSVSGGIHHALASAWLLAAALAGGTPYEQAIAPIVERVRREAAKVAETYLLTSLSIARRGECRA